MKLFLTEMSPIIRSIINLKETQDYGYLLCIFECHICDKKIRRDKFNLIEIRNIIISDEQVAKMNLDKSLEGSSVCELERISPPDVKSKHVVICITGFLQEDQPKS